MDDIGISTLRPGGDAPSLEVRVIRTWKPAFRDNEICYIFVDKEGIGIQAMARGRDQRFVFSKLQVQKCYKINGYACTEPDRYTSTVSHPAYMRIGSASVFTLIPDTPELPTQYFEFWSRRRLDSTHIKIKDGTQEKNRVILDYIGILQRLQDNTTNNGKPYVTMTLTDCSNEDVTVRLWEEITSSPFKFPRLAIESSVEPTILAFTALRLTDFMGKLQLQSTNATHVYVNPSTPETRILLNIFEKSKAEKTDTHRTGRTVTEEEASHQPNITLSELLRKDANELKGNIYIIRAAVTEINMEKEWHSMGCPNCDQSLIKAGATWFCSMHGNVDSRTAIYRINATISDNTGSIPALIFNEPSAQLTGLNCKDILAAENPNITLQQIINKEALFHIQAHKNSRTSAVRCTVIKINKLAEDAAATPVPITPSVHQPLHRSEASSSTKRSLFQDESPSYTKKWKDD